jgi:toluene-4-monooxygenase system protein B
MLVPLYGFVQGDTLGLLVLVPDDGTVGAVAEKLQQAAAVRVAPRRRVHVYFRGQRLDPDLTVAAAGLVSLGRVDVVSADD